MTSLLEQFNDDSAALAAQSAEIAQLRARIAELEARPCPYLNQGGVTRYCTINGAPDARVADLLALLRDVWNQFSIERTDGSRWHGGLSVLEDVEIALDDAEVER